MFSIVTAFLIQFIGEKYFTSEKAQFVINHLSIVGIITQHLESGPPHKTK